MCTVLMLKLAGSVWRCQCRSRLAAESSMLGFLWQVGLECVHLAATVQAEPADDALDELVHLKAQRDDLVVHRHLRICQAALVATQLGLAEGAGGVGDAGELGGGGRASGAGGDAHAGHCAGVVLATGLCDEEVLRVDASSGGHLEHQAALAVQVAAILLNDDVVLASSRGQPLEAVDILKRLLVSRRVMHHCLVAAVGADALPSEVDALSHVNLTLNEVVLGGNARRQLPRRQRAQDVGKRAGVCAVAGRHVVDAKVAASAALHEARVAPRVWAVVLCLRP
mmetsp:Transcript_32936/g.84149  ORF Transcript_32936/g.84149 Transcript_32936/m.84149 type:complete len:282 (-) Transcript_32936:1866-2711(-)